jgi:hypothetical protein
MPLNQDRSNMGTDVYDIFSGTSENDAVWLEDVVGMERAVERMQAIAAAKPGNYFVFHTQTQAIIANTNKTKAGAAG